MKKKNPFDMLKFLDFYGIPNDPNSSVTTEEFTAITCPYCGEQDLLGGHLTRGYFSCWAGCSQAKDFWGTLKTLSGEPDARPILKQFGGYISQNASYHQDNTDKKPRPTKIVVPGSSGITPKHKAYSYLREVRGFDPELLFRQEGLTFTTHGAGNYSYRIIFPIRDRNSRIVSYQGRDYTQDPDKVRFAACKGENEIINHQHIIYNQHNCSGENILLTEGIFDVLRFGKFCSSTFGISFTTEQANLLRKYYKNVFIAFDNEEKAQEQADKLGYMIASGRTNVEVVSFGLEGNDIDEMFRDREDDIIAVRKELHLY